VIDPIHHAFAENQREDEQTKRTGSTVENPNSPLRSNSALRLTARKMDNARRLR
jgi:hypothetical protein